MGHQIGGVATYIAGYITNNNGNYYGVFRPAAFMHFMASLSARLFSKKTIGIIGWFVTIITGYYHCEAY